MAWMLTKFWTDFAYALGTQLGHEICSKIGVRARRKLNPDSLLEQD